MEMITLSRTCSFCGNNHFTTFDKNLLEEGMRKYNAGALIQNAFPDFTPDEREFLKTGICNDCWNNM